MYISIIYTGTFQVKAAQVWNCLLTSLQFRDLKFVRIHIHTPYKMSWSGAWTRGNLPTLYAFRFDYMSVTSVISSFNTIWINSSLREHGPFTWCFQQWPLLFLPCVVHFSQQLRIVTDSHLSHSVTSLTYDTKLCTMIRVLLGHTDGGRMASTVFQGVLCTVTDVEQDGIMLHRIRWDVSYAHACKEVLPMMPVNDAGLQWWNTSVDPTALITSNAMWHS